MVSEIGWTDGPVLRSQGVLGIFGMEFGAQKPSRVRKECPPVNYHGNGKSTILMIFYQEKM